MWIFQENKYPLTMWIFQENKYPLTRWFQENIYPLTMWIFQENKYPLTMWIFQENKYPLTRWIFQENKYPLTMAKGLNTTQPLHLVNFLRYFFCRNTFLASKDNTSHKIKFKEWHSFVMMWKGVDRGGEFRKLNFNFLFRD